MGIFLIIVFWCGILFAQDSSAQWFIFSAKGIKAKLISQDVFMGSMDYTYSSPTATDGSGNFYYCSSDDNPSGFLWIIRKVDRNTGKVSEICRLNLSSYNDRYIRAINLTSSGALYVWLGIKRTSTNQWDGALVEITGF